jgi:hypothetical protein
MRQLVLALSAFGILGFVGTGTTPARAAETVIIKRHHDHPRFFDHFHRGNKTVIIKKHDNG